MAITLRNAQNGDVVTLSEQQLKDWVDTHSEQEVQQALSQLHPDDVKTVVNTYNQLSGTNIDANAVTNWAQPQSTSPTLNQPTTSQITTNDIKGYETYGLNPNKTVGLLNNISSKYNLPSKMVVDNTSYYSNMLNDLATKYKTTPEDIVNNGKTYWDTWQKMTPEEKYAKAQQLGVNVNQLDQDIQTMAMGFRLEQPGYFRDTVGNVNKIDYLAQKYKTTPDNIKNNYSQYVTTWNSMNDTQKQEAAAKLGVSVDELNKDINLMTHGQAMRANPATTGQNYYGAASEYVTKQIGNQTYQVPVLNKLPYVDTSWMINPEISATQIKSPNSITAKTADVAQIPQYLDPEKMKQDIYEGIKAQVDAEKQQALDQSNAQFSKLGLFRSGANLKNQSLIEQKAMQSLAEGYGKAATDVANLQTQMAMKQADIENQTNLQNMMQQNDMAIKQYLSQADIAMKQGDMDMATKFQNAANILNYQNLVSSVQMNNLQNGTQLYGMESDKLMKYDMAAADYLKSMDLANVDMMTRLSTSYYDRSMELVKQAIANKNYDEATKIKDDLVTPYLTALLPTIIQYTGNKADTETLQDAYKSLYGLEVDTNTLNDMIDDLNKKYEELKNNSQYTTTDYNDYR